MITLTCDEMSFLDLITFRVLMRIDLGLRGVVFGVIASAATDQLVRIACLVYVRVIFVDTFPVAHFNSYTSLLGIFDAFFMNRSRIGVAVALLLCGEDEDIDLCSVMFRATNPFVLLLRERGYVEGDVRV